MRSGAVRLPTALLTTPSLTGAWAQGCKCTRDSGSSGRHWGPGWAHARQGGGVFGGRLRSCGQVGAGCASQSSPGTSFGPGTGRPSTAEPGGAAWSCGDRGRRQARWCCLRPGRWDRRHLSPCGGHGGSETRHKSRLCSPREEALGSLQPQRQDGKSPRSIPRSAPLPCRGPLCREAPCAQRGTGRSPVAPEPRPGQLVSALGLMGVALASCGPPCSLGVEGTLPDSPGGLFPGERGGLSRTPSLDCCLGTT